MKVNTPKISSLILAFLSTIVIHTRGQGFDNHSRSVYIMDIAKYVQYSNIDDIDTLKIGVLEPAEDLFPVLSTLAFQRESIQDRPVKVVRFTEIDSITPVNILYVNKRYNYDISLVRRKIRGLKTLLISENYEFQRSMINFIIHDGKKSFELNEDLLNSEGLFVSELFKEHAVTTEADWQEIYKKVELELEKEKTLVLEQNKLIESQTEEIEKQEKRIFDQRQVINSQTFNLENLKNEIGKRQQELENKNKRIVSQNEAIEEQLKNLERNKQEMQNQQNAIERQKAEISDQKKILGLQLEQIEKQKILIWSFIAMLLLSVLIAYFIYKNYKLKKEANIKLEQKNQMIVEQRDKIEKQRDNIAEQKQLITDSLYYAQRIQRAILTDETSFLKGLEHFLIIYLPKDIVSGDFYWQSKINGETIIVAADCTGHGVPGALMSMLGVTFLNDIVNHRKITRPDEILNALRENVIDALNQRGKKDNYIYDGMDVAALSLNYETETIQYAGAYNPLFLIRDGELLHYKADRMSVAMGHNMTPFTNHAIDLQRGDLVYVFSDGYVDQFGGRNDKKFMRKQLQRLLLEIHDQPMEQQQEILEKRFFEWKGDNEQTDDVVMIGLKL